MAKRAQLFPVTILSERVVVFEGDCEAIFVPSSRGQIAILSQHTPMIARLEKGDVYVRANSSNRLVAKIETGLLHVGDNEAVVLLDL